MTRRNAWRGTRAAPRRRLAELRHARRGARGGGTRPPAISRHGAEAAAARGATARTRRGRRPRERKRPLTTGPNTELIDGQVRVVDIRTAHGRLRRPTARLAVLPTEAESSHAPTGGGSLTAERDESEAEGRGGPDLSLAERKGTRAHGKAASLSAQRCYTQARPAAVPISLLSGLAKLYKRVLKTRLSAHLLAKGLIIDEQFGFRPAHSCPQQVLRLVEYVTEGFKLKQKTVAVFFDVAKAFDRVWHAEQEFRKAPPSLPSCNSVYTNDIPRSSSGVQLALFADDTALYLRGQTERNICPHLQKAIEELARWFQTWRIEVNAEKSAAISFIMKGTGKE
ncbi:RNA-directed DNA polymerase from mobile element jockey [Eumeta japonica]|uniref:RNA-directed DNA polymerase from mobile element jockey n=1 Tax=Eumeta variegata TaxID=151549 RepID=A0A4C1WVY4_EUMVA|nr:RNA-directed DNA polymerase from mobile element jockey [Eumeta japonica]